MRRKYEKPTINIIHIESQRFCAVSIRKLSGEQVDRIEDYSGDDVEEPVWIDAKRNSVWDENDSFDDTWD